MATGAHTMTLSLETIRRSLTLATHHVRSLPILILLPHSACNARCVMCDIWRANANKRELTRAELEPHLADLRRLGVRWVVLSGGEALLHSNLWGLCALLREAGVRRITLLSTGLLLERSAREVVAECDEVIVSLDGPPATHDRIRNVPRAYERLAQGVAAVKAARPGFRVTGRSVVQRLNFRELSATVETAHQAQLDQISFLPADVSSEAFNRPTGPLAERVEEVALTAEDLPELRRAIETTIDRHAADFDSGFIAERPAKLWRLFAYYAALLGQGDFPRTTCNAPWVSAVIEADGMVRPCFFHKPLGRISDGPLGTIINSASAVAFRRSLDVETDPICRKCVCTLALSPFTDPLASGQPG